MKKSDREKIDEPTNFILKVMKISCDETRQQDCISNLANIRVNNVNNVIIRTLNIKWNF